MTSRRSTPKRHHFVPEMLQRHFADADLRLWFFDKQHPERGVKRKPIALLFRAWHLYTVRNPDGTRDASTETRLSAIETRAGPIVTRLIEEARAGHCGSISATDHKALVDLFVAQFRRSPDFQRQALRDRTAAEMIADDFARWEARYGPASPEERAFLLSPKYAEEAERNHFAASAADPLILATGAMMQRGFRVARIGLPRRSFILGSSPFARFMSRSQQRQDLGDPEAELWLPIAPDVALGSYGFAGETGLMTITQDVHIRQVNWLIAQASTAFASPNRELVEALSRRARRASP